MAVLALDTASARCGAALWRGDAPLIVRDVMIGRGHEAVLPGLVRDVLGDAGVSATDVSRIAVCVGPGSFAGVRVGVAFARGVALAAGIPCVGVNGLDLLARSLGDGAGGLCVGVMDARRGEVAWRAFLNGEGLGAPVCQPVGDAREALLGLADGKQVVLAGSGAELVSADGLVDSGVRTWPMESLAIYAADRDPSAFPPRPYYHRPPDAKAPTPRGLGASP